LIADREGGHAALIDAGGPTKGILEALDVWNVTLDAVLCTHHHIDHVQHKETYRSRFGCPICAHRAEARWMPDLDRKLEDGEEIQIGDLTIRALLVPGHTAGQLSFLVDEKAVFTGDTLFKGSIGGTVAPGHSTFEDLKRSLLDVLLRLPAETKVYPGHCDPTTIARERAENPFLVALSAGVTPAGRSCMAMGRPAELLLRAEDYAGGSKCWVRFVDDRSQAIVPGSQVHAKG
jgi:glyoxylase-like metal-dependent hydrolase (beta-lactamase superfamily II)